MNRVTCGRWAIIHLEAAKACFERGDLKSAEHWLQAAARRWHERKNLSMRPEANLLTMRKFWGRCCFCGASNGLYWQPLKQHTTRCRYRGNSNDFSQEVPNYFKVIDEDDETFLPKIRAVVELKRVQVELEKIAAVANYDTCEHPTKKDKDVERKHSLVECIETQLRSKKP